MKTISKSILVYCFFCFCCLFADDVLDKAKDDIEKLTSPDFLGRGYQKDGHIKVADFLESELKQIGVEPLNSKYYHKFSLKANLIASEPQLKFNDNNLKLGIDYLPNAVSGSGKIKKENVIFLNHGLYIPEMNINDYAGKENLIEGSVVVIDNVLPEYIKNDKSIQRKYLSENVKIDIAQQLNAKALILLVDKLSYGSAYKRADIPIFDVQKKTFSPEIEQVSLEVKTSFEKVQSRNVFGIIPGTSKSDSILILCAHYDHLGAIGDSIYFPGANDNASGVSMVLNLTRYFQNNRLPYSIVPIFFSGEEIGLIGSRYFVENPTFDLAKCKFLLNFDCVCSGENGLMAQGGSDFPEYFKILNSVNDSLNLGNLSKRKNSPNGDHYFFINNDVKGFYIYTKDGKQPYHHILDRIDSLEWDDYYHVYELIRRFLITLS